MASPALKPSGSLALLYQQILSAYRVSTHIFVPAHILARLVGPHNHHVAYNNNDILMVPYEDLPDRDKDVISKAIEEF